MKSNCGKWSGIWAIIFLLQTLFIPGDSMAMPPGEEPPPIRAMGPVGFPPLSFWRNDKIIETLKVTDDQGLKLKDADFSYREKKLALRAQLDQLHLKLEKAFSVPPPNKDTVMELAGKIADLQGKHFILDMEYRVTVDSILTPDQLKKLMGEFPLFPPMHPGGHRPERFHAGGI